MQHFKRPSTLNFKQIFYKIQITCNNITIFHKGVMPQVCILKACELNYLHVNKNKTLILPSVYVPTSSDVLFLLK